MVCIAENVPPPPGLAPPGLLPPGLAPPGLAPPDLLQMAMTFSLTFPVGEPVKNPLPHVELPVWAPGQDFVPQLSPNFGWEAEYVHRHWTVAPACSLQKCGPPSESEETASTADSSNADSEQAGAEHGFLALYGDDEERSFVLGSIITQLQVMIKTQHGSRLVQAALEIAEGEELKALLAEVEGVVVEACKSPHGNHVVTKCLDIDLSQARRFISQMKGKGVALTRDRFGCRIVQHMIEKCPLEDTTSLIDEVLSDAPRLVRHPFGNFVMQSIVKHGLPIHSARMVDVLMTDAPSFSKHRFAKHIVRLAVVHAEPAEGARLLHATGPKAAIGVTIE